MRIKDASKTFGGACLVYAVIAACSGGGHPATVVDADGSAPNGHDGSPPSGHDGAGGDLVDALTSPVTDAKADPSTSGTRLKAKYYAGADGSREFAGWHDSQRDQDCSFLPASDGLIRCVISGAGLSGYFADAKSLRPVRRFTAGKRRFASSDLGPACPRMSSSTLCTSRSATPMVRFAEFSSSRST